MNREPPSPQGASTEQMSAVPSPGLAETLPPSGLASIGRQPALPGGKASPPAKRDSTSDQRTVAMNQLERLSAIVEREARKSGPAPAKPAAQNRSETRPVKEDAADEESLENYLESFMERLTGKRSEAAEQVAKTVPGMPVFPSRAAQPDQPAKQPPPPPREPSKAPECRETLTAMRELANQNARCAVAHHATVDLSGRARLALVAATGCSLLSCALACSALALESRWCLWCSASAGCLAAIVACRFFLLCRKFHGRGCEVGEA